ncbi:hypothetical protein GO296_02692 [Ralstonia solanacearum]|nr:hypothetical protein [Ralstonia solanacearum]NKF65506.1 hypothetical protein [Ralstonia solanacearum]NKF69143.1 hypothetical protein [Ralstonia solanacearum]
MPVRSVVGEDRSRLAVLFIAREARVAVLARIDHASDANRVPHLKAGDFATDPRDASDDFVTRHDRVVRIPAMVLCDVEVCVADAAVEYVQNDIVRTWLPPLKAQWYERIG